MTQTAHPMRPRAARLSCLLLLVALVTGKAAGAQTTGQLSGTVRDAQTGETLPGANILIDGTTQGASTDMDGGYRIIGIRPGTYTLVASFVGYTPMRVEGVRVNVDLTTTTDFALQPESFQGEEVVVTANADLVRRDLTSSEFRVTSESIESLPVQEIGDILRTQAGVTTSGAGFTSGAGAPRRSPTSSTASG